MNLLDYILPFLLALGILIVVHEFGHYAVARLCGVKVLRFSLGFGKPLLVRKAGADQTEWVLAAFPLGGYVKMLDEREAPVAAHELHRAFNRQSVWRRIAVVAAGPLANFVLAIAFTGGFTPAVSKSCARGWPRRGGSRRPMRVSRGRAGALDQWRSRRDLAGVSLEAAQSGPRQAGGDGRNRQRQPGDRLSQAGSGRGCG
jgi:hypothetical protein